MHVLGKEAFLQKMARSLLAKAIALLAGVKNQLAYEHRATYPTALLYNEL